MAVAVLVAVLALGVVAADLDDRAIGLLLLVGSVAGSVVVFQATKQSRLGGLGPGVLLAVAALGTAFLLGLLSGDYRGIRHEQEVSLLFGVAVACLLGGAVAYRLVARTQAASWPGPSTPNPFAVPLLGALAGAILLLEAINLVTGTIPLLSSNIDETRFVGGAKGAFEQFGVFLIGGVEWLVLAGAAAMLVRKRFDRAPLVLVLLGLATLGLLASRSFVLIVGLALIVALATLGRVSIWRLLVMAALGLALLGAAGAARVENSDPTGERRAFLASHGYDGIGGLVVQSASSGPYVFGVAADTIPARIPYQHGAFFLRDFRSQLPGHPFGRPQRSDEWITSEILQRDPASIGGSPPTLAGGLYIDFGLVGVVAGCLLLGYALAALYSWAKRARTVGALALYGYASAWVALSAYSYISLKPIALTVFALCWITHRVETAQLRPQAQDSPAGEGPLDGFSDPWRATLHDQPRVGS